jgi:uncharacterized DUF497 family protein
MSAQYIRRMEAGIDFNQSAFKHGVKEKDIRHILDNPRYEGPLKDDDNKYIVIGFDNSGNLLEIMYNLIDNETVNVFHALYFSTRNAEKPGVLLSTQETNNGENDRRRSGRS